MSAFTLATFAPGAPAIVHDMAVVLGVAAVTTIVFRRLQQPVVLGYLLAGLLVGPFIPLPLFADPERVRALSELGVILVMFGVGLEFSPRRLMAVLPRAGLATAIEVFAVAWLGSLVGRALGWDAIDSAFLGACISMSSTMIVTRTFAEQGVRDKRSEMTVAMCVVEDLGAVLLVTLATGLAAGRAVSGIVLAGTLAQLAAFLVGMVALGFLIVPRTIRLVAASRSPETLLVAAMGLCFGLSLLAADFGYSVALGAFLAGSLVAESGLPHTVGRLVAPLRDVFAAIFFVAVGMSVDPLAVLAYPGTILAVTAALVVGKVVFVTAGVFFTGHDLRTAIKTGLSLAQMGEFSFILAGIGVTAGAVHAALLPAVVAAAVITTFLTPWFVRRSDRWASAFESRLPRPVATFTSLYAGWLESLRTRGPLAGSRGLLAVLVLDGTLLGVLVIAVSLAMQPLVALVGESGFLPGEVGRWAVLAGAVVAALPFALGIVRAARKLGALIAQAALPPAAAGQADFAAAPRRMFVVVLQLGAVMIVLVPLLAVTQPFLPAGIGAPVLAAILLGTGWSFWRRATDLHEHVRAGTALVLEVLNRQNARPLAATDGGRGVPIPSSSLVAAPLFEPEPEVADLDRVQDMLPGLGTLEGVQVRAGSRGDGRTLGELDLRGRSGATVIALVRDGEALAAPTGRARLRAGDRLALAGTHEALRAARELLDADAPPRLPPASPPSSATSLPAD